MRILILSVLLSLCAPVFAEWSNLNTPYSEEADKAAFYPGSFDPPTRSHLATVVSLITEYDFAKVYVVLNTRGPKNYMASIDERLTMMKAGLSDLLTEEQMKSVEFVLEPVDGKEPLKFRIQKKIGKLLYGVTGGDGWELLPQSAKDDTVRKWIIMPRPELGEVDFPQRDNILIMTPKGMEDGTSSSFIRKEIAKGNYPLGPLPVAVADVIKKNEWYKDSPEQRAFNEVLYEKDWQEYRVQFDLPNMEMPEFKEGQTRTAWRENFVRKTVEYLGLEKSKARIYWLKAKAYIKGHSVTTCFKKVSFNFF